VLGARILTALVLIPIVGMTTIYLSSITLALLLGAFVLLGAWEWAALAKVERPAGRWFFVMVTSVLMLLTYALLKDKSAMIALCSAALIWWAVACSMVIRCEQTGRSPASIVRNFCFLGWFVLIPAWLSIIWIHHFPQTGPGLVLLLLLIIWGADTAAYLVGKRWGRHRLAPRVSPGKTWEGVIAAIVASISIAWAGVHFLPGLESRQALALVAVATVAVVFSVVGDLTESLVKRAAGVKDSGQLLPGHGGVLDRIDSLTAAAPTFSLGLAITGLAG